MLPKELFTQWKQFRPKAYTVGLQTKTPLGTDTTMKGLKQISMLFPNLTESSFDKEKGKFKLENDEIDADKQIYFKIEGFNTFEYAWGPLVEMDFQSVMDRLFNEIQDGFELSPININLIDVRFVALSKWEGHHYRIIWDTFLKDTLLDSLFNKQDLLQDDLFFRAMLDDARICVININSNVTDAEVRRNNFENDLLRASIGIAQTRKIPVNSRISELFAQHTQIALSFIQDKFIPYIVEPLDKMIQEFSKKELKNG